MPNFDISEILARGQQQRPQMPITGIGAALPMIGGLVGQGVQQFGEEQKKRSVIQAQQDYAQFLSMSPEDRARPENAQKGYQAALSLGMNPQSIAIPKPPTAKPAKSLSEIEAESEARAKGTAKGSGQTLGPDAMSNYAKELAGGSDAGILAKSLGRAAYKSMPKIIAQAYKINPNLKIQTNALDYQTKQALMKTDMGSAIQLPARKIASILPRIDSAVQASNKIPRTSIQIINRLGIAAAAKTGNREAQDLLNKAKLVADEFQSTIGSGSDSKLDLALDLLNTAQTVEQFQDAARNMKDAMTARREALLTGKVPESSPGETPSASSYPSATQSGIDAL